MGHQAAIAAQPGECALDHPAAAQDLEAALLVGAFDDFQLEGQPDELARELGSGIATVSKDLFQARIFLERPLDQTSGTVAILDISRNYLEREEVAFGVDERIALNAFNFLARIVADRINGDPPCMGRFLSRGCPTGPINFLRRSFFASPGSRSRSCRAVSAGARFLQGISLVRPRRRLSLAPTAER